MKSFTSTDPQSHAGITNTWLTPLWLIKELGAFDLDPCGFPGHETAKERFTLVDGMNGLKEPWFGRVWLNPPYGRGIGEWLKKLQNHGNGIALVFARTDTRWFQEISPDVIYFLKSRIKFLTPEFKENSNAGAPSMLLAWGEYNQVVLGNCKLKGKYVIC